MLAEHEGGGQTGLNGTEVRRTQNTTQGNSAHIKGHTTVEPSGRPGHLLLRLPDLTNLKPRKTFRNPMVVVMELQEELVQHTGQPHPETAC